MSFDSIKKVFCYFVLVAAFCSENIFAAGKQELIPLETEPVEYKEIYCNWLNKNAQEFISFEEMKEDLEEFNYIISTTYAGYDQAVERGLDLNAVKDELCNDFYGYERIRTDEFIDHLKNILEFKIVDHHFSIHGNRVYWFLSGNYIVHFSDVYGKIISSLENEGLSKKLVITESNAEELKSGDEIEVNAENIFSYPAKGKDIYRLGIVNWRDEKNLKLKFNDDYVYVPVKRYQCIDTRATMKYGERTTSDSAYVSISHFFPPRDDSYFKNGADKAFRKFVDFGIKNRNKKNIIIDLRSNQGGYSVYSKNLFYGLYSGITESQVNKMSEKKRELFYTIYNQKILAPCFSDAYMIESPASVQNFINGFNVANKIKNASAYEKRIYQLFSEMLKEQKKNPEKKVYDYIDFTLLAEPEIKNNSAFKIPARSAFTGNLIIIADRNSASAAELAIVQARSIFGKDTNVYVIGENTMGCISYGAVDSYYFPKSKAFFNICLCDFTGVLGKLPEWHGEGYGFYPDYWCTDEDILETLVYITAVYELRDVLKNLYWGLM